MSLPTALRGRWAVQGEGEKNALGLLRASVENCGWGIG